MAIEDSVIQVAGNWGLTVKSIRKDIHLTGSPERCELRFAIECELNRIYVLESIFDEDFPHKSNIISCLDALSKQNLMHVHPYLYAKNNDAIIRHQDRYWQLSPYISGVPLKRPAYVFDRWRGNVLADFLIHFHKTSKNLPCTITTEPFSIKKYINKLLAQIRRFEPKLLSDLMPVTHFLEKSFLDIHDSLPIAFCHGDFHPLNIIWGADCINAVIDWEFLGEKPEIYDMANMLGCIGIEEPEGLAGDLVKDFITRLKQENILSDLSWNYLVEFIVALRFAWLSEWLRHKDKDMIELETVYMKLLVNNHEKIKELWEL